MTEIMIAETAVPGGRNLHRWRHYEHRQLADLVKHSFWGEYLLKPSQNFHGLLPWPPWMIAIMIAEPAILGS